MKLDYRSVLLRRHAAHVESQPEPPEGPISMLELKNRGARRSWIAKRHELDREKRRSFFLW